LYGIPLLLSIIGAAMLWMVASPKVDHAPFARTTAELKKDADWLMTLL
jgi:hypothetical protein